MPVISALPEEVPVKEVQNSGEQLDCAGGENTAQEQEPPPPLEQNSTESAPVSDCSGCDSDSASSDGTSSESSVVYSEGEGEDNGPTYSSSESSLSDYSDSTSSSSSELQDATNRIMEMHFASMPHYNNLINSDSSSDSELEASYINVSDKVERENRKNIVKTLQGQADIITNWTRKTRESDGKEMWILMDGKPYSHAARIHSNANKPLLKSLSTVNTSKVGKTSECSSEDASSSTKQGDTADDQKLLDIPSSSLDSNKPDGSGETNETIDEPLKEVKKKLHPCGQCDLHFKGKFYWYKHVISEHGREQREMQEDTLYDCSYCHKQFGRKRTRDFHQKTHGDFGKPRTEVLSGI